jgi:hypothetical protein
MELVHRNTLFILCAFIFGLKQQLISCLFVNFKTKPFYRYHPTKASMDRELWAEKVEYFDLNAPVTSAAVNTRY